MDVMKIYTSYYARVKDLPKGLVPISISRKTPYFLNVRGCEPDLAPSNSLFKGYHQGTIDTQAYERIFNQGLSKLDVDFKAETLQRMAELCGGRHAVLLCYEKPEDFCHRHLVAEWLRAHGYDCTELAFDQRHAARYPDDVLTTLITTLT